MKLKYKSASLLLVGLIISWYSVGYAADFNSADWLATEVLVSSNDTTFKNIYYYNKFDKMVLSASYLKSEDGAYKAVNQTEWIYDQLQLTDEIYSEYISDKAVRKLHIKHKYSDNKPDLIESYDQNNNLIKSIDYIYTDGLLTTIEEKGNETQGIIKLINYSYSKDTITETSKYYKDQSLTDTQIILKISDAKNRLSKVIYQKVLDQIPVNEKMFIYSYKNAIDTLVQSIRQLNWNANSKSWENSHKTEYLYTNSGKIKSETSSLWLSRFWREDFRNFNEYDASDNLILKSKQIPLYQKWRTLSSVNYNRSELSLVAESAYGFWGGESGTLLRTDIPVVFNNLNILVNAEKVEVNLVHTSADEFNSSKTKDFLYPNPSQGLLYLNNVQQANSLVRIFTYDGKLMLEQNIPANSGVLDAGVLPEGNYLLQLKSNQLNVNQKITIRK